jgi:3-oxoacyl-[acyl-carrier protein] reductase
MENRVAIITGASRGIGAKIAKEFAKNNYNVVINYNNSFEQAQKICEEIKKINPNSKTLAIKADVSKIDDSTKLVEETIAVFGKIDVLVNNAGITIDKLFLRMTLEDFNKVMQVNVNSVFNMTKACYKMLSKSGKGRIINLSSIVGLHGNIGQANYSASKAAIIGFTKTIAREFAAKNITVNAIAPGFIQSDMTDQLSETIKEEILKTIPLKRFGQADDIASLALFLADEKNSFITGQTFVIDGGMTI